MSETSQPVIDVQAAFDPELRQAQSDINLYAENRPYADSKGNIHDPANNKFVNTDDYFDSQRQIHKDDTQTPYEDMSMTDLARKLAEAEFHNDRTSSTNISDVLVEKLAAQEDKMTSEERKADENYRIRGDEHTRTDDNQNGSDNLWDRVMGVKEKELARLQEKAKPAEDEVKKQDIVQAQIPVTTGKKPVALLNRADSTWDYDRNRPKGKDPIDIKSPADKPKDAPKDPADKPKDTTDTDTTSGEFEFPHQRLVQYEAREDGKIQLGIKIDEPGVKLEINKHDKTKDPANRRFIATDSQGNEYDVRDRYIRIIGKDRGPDADRSVYSRFVGSLLRDPTIGEPWHYLDKRTTSYPIVSVEIATEFAEDGADLSVFEENGIDIFEDNDLVIAAAHQRAVEERERNFPETRVNRINSPATRRGRLAERLRSHRRIVAFVGAVAIAGIAAASLLGGGNSSSHKETRPAPKVQSAGKPGAEKTKTNPSAASSSSAVKAAGRSVTSVMLQDGSNPWVVSAQQLGLPNTAANAPAIYDYDAEMAKLNPDVYSMNSNDHRAENLAPGTTLTLPRR